MTNPPEAIREQIQALRLAYAENLVRKIAEIDAAWALLERGTWTPEALEAFHRQVHALAGSGAIFGFPAVSEKARGLEQILRVLQGRTARPEADTLGLIADRLAALKLAAQQPQQGVEATTEVAPPGEPDDHLIFLIARDASFREELSHQLGHFGYAVRTFADAEGLRAPVERERPGAIIADLPAPPADRELLREVGALPLSAERRIPILFLSSKDDIASRFEAVRTGGSGYFAKPLDVGLLIDHLDLFTSHYTQEPYRILIVDDDPVSARDTQAALEGAGMTARVVSDPMQVLNALVEVRPDLVLMDVYLPGCTGIELASVIHQQEKFVGIPIVFLSIETDVARQLAALRQGGDDFLTKPIAPAHLVSSVASRAQRARILRSQMVRDSLTGVLNHSRLTDQLQIEVARARRQSTRLAYAMIDIDHFKAVNDAHGHQAGDAALRAVAWILRDSLRVHDVPGRYGGEEFGVVLPGIGAAGAHAIAERIRKRIESSVLDDKRGVRVTASIGFAPLEVQDVEPSAWVARADRALYRAKDAGRNCSVGEPTA